MAKVGRFVTDPKAGAYCQITLDSGEKIVVNHDKGGLTGARFTLAQSTLRGLSSSPLVGWDRARPGAAAALRRLTAHAQGAEATPLGAFVECVKHCASVAEVKTRCATLMTG